jgi:sulfoacetaldehyde acetyltransferase
MRIATTALSGHKISSSTAALSATVTGTLPAALKAKRTRCGSATIPSRRSMSSGKKQLMTNSEAFVETLLANKVDTTFGIVGSAFMDALDLFDVAKIRFVSVQHEQNAAHMADGYARVTNQPGVCIAQNGPGITNFVTGVAAAYWAHSPVVAITPEAGTMTKGYGGFQECDQLPIFEPITKAQVNVNNPARMAELTGRAFHLAMLERGPVQLNIARDFFYGEHEFVIPQPTVIEHGAGGPAALDAAAKLLSEAKNPVILAGGGVVMGEAGKALTDLAEKLRVPVCTTYLHNDAFPQSHELYCGPLGYQGSQTAMNVIQEADVVLALGTRLGPFGTLPQYGIDYWPKNAKVIQVDINQQSLGLVQSVDVMVHGDSGQAASAILQRITQTKPACLENVDERMQNLKQHREAWIAKLDEMTNGPPHPPSGKMKPRQALRELQKAMPDNAVVATDIGNICSVSNSYLGFDTPGSFLAAMTFGNCGYSFPAAMGAKVGAPDRFCVGYAGEGAWGMSLNEVLTCVREDIPTTAVVFNNGQWGAEKKNQVLWFGDRYIGTQLKNPSFAEVAQAMGAEGIRVSNVDEVGDALRTAADNQKNGKTTVIELMMSRELGDPFRRDAMKLPKRHLTKYKCTDRDSESETGQPIDVTE